MPQYCQPSIKRSPAAQGGAEDNLYQVLRTAWARESMNKVAIFLILLKYIILIKRAQRKNMGSEARERWQYSIVGLLLHTLRHIWGRIRSYFHGGALSAFCLLSGSRICLMNLHFDVAQKKIAVESKADGSICLWNIALAMLTSDEISRTSVTATKEDAACCTCVCVCAPSGRKINSYFMQTHSEGKKVEARERYG